MSRETGIVDAKERTDTEVDYETTEESVDITVARYNSNPGADPTFSGIGKYIDLHLDIGPGEEVTEILMKVYYRAGEVADIDESSLKLHWWNGSEWVGGSESGVIYPADGPTYRG